MNIVCVTENITEMLNQQKVAFYVRYAEILGDPPSDCPL